MSRVDRDAVAPIDPATLTRLIAGTFVQSAEHHTVLTSTNDRGMELARTNSDQACLIYAETQTAGRGRGDHQWHSAPGSLTCSLLVPCPSASATVGSLHVAVAIAKACNAFLKDREISVKWPNDLYFARRKLGGILIESPAASSQWIVGIGLNVNNEARHIDPAATSPISLAEVAETPLNRANLLHELLLQLGLLCHGGSFATLPTLAPDDWSHYCMLSGKQITVDTPHGEISGMCRGIDANGRLLLQEDNANGIAGPLHALASANGISLT